jgi:hypothetical protein
VIHNFESRLFAEIVDAGDIEEIIERKLISAQFRDVAQIRFADCVRYLVAKLASMLKFVGECLA